MRFIPILRPLLITFSMLATTLLTAQVGSMHELTPKIRVWLPVSPEFKETDHVKHFTAADENYFQVMIGLELEDDALSEIDTIETRYDKVQFYKNWCLRELWGIDAENILYSEPWYISRYQGYQYAFRGKTHEGESQIWATRIVLYQDEPLVFYATVGDNRTGDLILDKFFDSIQLDWDGSEVAWKELNRGSHTTAIKLAEDRKLWAAGEDSMYVTENEAEEGDEEEEIIVADAYRSPQQRADRMAEDLKDSTMMFMQVLGVLGFVALIIILLVRHKRLNEKRENALDVPTEPEQQPNQQPNSPTQQRSRGNSDRPDYPAQDASDDDRWRPQ